jgi:hypothetical protein
VEIGSAYRILMYKLDETTPLGRREDKTEMDIKENNVGMLIRF